MAQAGLQQRGGQPALAAPSLLLPGDARGVGFTPASLPGLVLWLDARSIGQVDNTSVSRWADQSGLGNDAVQGTVAAQPTYLATGLNGRPALSFDGTDDFLTTPSLHVAGDITVYLVARSPVTSGFFWTDSGGTRVVLYPSSPGQFAFFYASLQAGLFTDVTVARVYSGSQHAGTVTVSHDSGSVASATGATPGTVGVLTVGANASGNGSFANGALGALAVYAASHSAAQQVQMAQYLRARWGTP